MFAAPGNMDQRGDAEATVEEAKADRVPLEQDLDNLREKAFTAQQWATAAFGIPDAGGNQYRVTFHQGHYYVETVRKEAGRPAYGYVGVMVHERDIYALTQVLVQAVREKQKKESTDGTSRTR